MKIFSPTDSTYYRARVSNPNCGDVFSDTVIAFLEGTPPTFTCLSDINDNTDVSCNYFLPDYTIDAGLLASVADNCPGPITITQNIPPGTNVGSGQYDIWLYFEDVAGNIDSCSFVLTVEAFVGTRVVSCGDTYLGENTASFGNTEDNFTCSGFSTPGTDIYYQITVPNGNYLIQVNLDNMSSATNTFAGMFWLSSSCPGNTCGPADDFYYDISNQEFTHNNSNTQNFEAVGPGTYFLVIDGLSAGDLQYDISFDCIESGVNFDTDCGGSDLDSNGVITRVNGSTALNVNTCSNYEICNELIIQNNGIEWMDSVVFNLGPCYENVSNILPNGTDNGFYNGLGDWTQTNSPGQIIWTFDHSSNPEWGDGSTGNFTCSSFASFCFDADVSATCPDSTGLNIEIEVYDDGSGNANNTTVSFDVATAGGFILDNDQITMTCPGTQNENLNASCEVSLQDYTTITGIVDNCDPAPTVTQNPVPGTLINSDQVVWVISENIFGVKDSCSFLVQVFDAAAPVASCQNINVYLDGTGSATITTADIDNGSTDNCSTPTLSISQSSFNCNDVSVSPINVTLTATDTAGNTDNCVSQVTVLDTIKPNLTCPGNQMLALDATCNATLPNYTTGVGETDNCGVASVTQSPVAGTSINAPTLVTVTVTDNSGNTRNCSFTVNVEDTTDPIASCQNINVYLDGTGSATITAADVDNGSTDNCSTPTLSISQSSFNCADVSVGPINVTLTATDTAGNTDNCVSQVTVLDTISPNLSCPGNQMLSLDATCNATLPDYTTGVGETDNCGVASVIQSPVAGTSINAPTLVTVTVIDNSGNTRNCSFTVNVEDTADPIASCQNINVYLDGTGSATITAADIDNGSADNCSTPTLSISQSSFSCADVSASPINVTLTATDTAGNTHNCISQVMVLDTISPNFTCPGNQTLSAGTGCSATLPDYTTGVGETDNCGIVSVVQSPIAGTVITSSTLVTLTVTDNSGNTSSCSFTADVDDTTDPVASCQNINVYLDGTGSATITAADIDNGSTDNCSTPTLSISQSSFNCADVAASPVNVTLTATDGSANTASCVSQVTVLDTIKPNLTCPGNQMLALDATCNATLPNYTTGVGETDNCGVASVTQSPVAGTSINTPTLVTVTVTDNSGNTRNCSFTVNVEDTTDPIASCQNINVYLDGTGSATITAADVDNGSTDNCSTPTLSISQSSFNCADVSVGPINVTLTATDTAGNTDNCVSQVTVLDTISPNLSCPGNQMLTLDATCNASLPDYTTVVGETDNCGVASVTQSPVAGTSINAPTLVTVTVTDNSGNTRNCSFTVNVEDTTDPIASCQNINVYLDGSGSATIAAADIDNGSTDNCSTPALSISQSSFSCADVSASPINVTLTVTDTAGNDDNCVAQVTILDTVSPTALCQNITVYLDASGEVEIDETDVDAGSFDNCAVDEIDIDIEDFFCSDLGTNFVTLSIEDESGNISTCQAQVQVVDTISPIASCQNISVYLDGSGSTNISASDIDNGSTDNCGIPSLSISQSIFTCSDVGSSPINVTLTVTDNSGNSDNCTALVTVLDTISPSISCPLSITQCDSIVNYSNPVISDNCTGTTLTLISGLISGSDFPVGVTNVVYEVSDASGNTNTCDFNVEVLPLINSDFNLPDTLCLPVGVYDLETGVTLNNGETQQFYSTNGAQINGNNFLQGNNTGPGYFEITHVVSNGFCSDTTVKNIELVATVQNGFDLGPFICANLNQVNLNDFLDLGVSDTGYWSGISVMQDSMWDLSGLDGVYTLDYIIPQGQCSDTATGSVLVHPDVDPSIDLIDSICESETVLLDNYILGDGGGVFTGPQVTNNVLNTTGLGSYVLISYEVGEIGCQEQDLDSIFVELKPNVFISTDTAICGDSIHFNPNHSGLSTNWLNQASVTFVSNNNPNSDIIFSNEGVYDLVLESYTQQCVNSDTVNVQVYFEPTIVDAGPDQNIAFTTSTSMDALPPDYGSGTWLNLSGLLIDDPSSETSFIDNLQIGDNELIWSVSNGVCPVNYDTVIILVKEIEIVSGFSPNNDGKNEYFHIEGFEHLGRVKLSVFNRWGKLVFEEEDYQNDWNGDGFNGSLPADTYYYIIESDLNKQYNGYIVIRR